MASYTVTVSVVRIDRNIDELGKSGIVTATLKSTDALLETKIRYPDDDPPLPDIDLFREYKLTISNPTLP